MQVLMVQWKCPRCIITVMTQAKFSRTARSIISPVSNLLCFPLICFVSSLNPVPASSSCVMTSTLLGTPAATPCTPRRLSLRPSESSTNLRQAFQIYQKYTSFSAVTVYLILLPSLGKKHNVIRTYNTSQFYVDSHFIPMFVQRCDTHHQHLPGLGSPAPGARDFSSNVSPKPGPGVRSGQRRSLI